MIANGPTYGVAKRGQFLIKRSVSVTASTWNSGKPPKNNPHWCGSIYKPWTNDCTVGIDLVGIETNARKPLFICQVGPSVQVLVVEASSCFVDKRVGKNTRVRK